MNSTWVKHAISEINADYQRSADTHLIRLALPGFAQLGWHIDLARFDSGLLQARRAGPPAVRLRAQIDRAP